MDATGSMAELLTKSKNTVGEMFERATNILKKAGVTAVFEVQFVVYRNYDCVIEELLQHSGWESDASNLRQFMSTISAYGGTWEPEAVEIGLHYVNRLSKENGDNPLERVNQVILIGDAPPNTRELVAKGRSEHLGEDYWRRAKDYATPTYVDEEVKALAQKEIPVHAFYVAESARLAFEEISRATNGQSGALDIHSPAGAEKLTEIVTERILSNLGGDALVDLYRQTYVKGYVSSVSRSKMAFFQGGASKPVPEDSSKKADFDIVGQDVFQNANKNG
jgi:hypothetical protein